jgi:hypothetical protein
MRIDRERSSEIATLIVARMERWETLEALGVAGRGRQGVKPGTPVKPPAIRIWKETAHRGGKGVSAIHGIRFRVPRSKRSAASSRRSAAPAARSRTA